MRNSKTIKKLWPKITVNTKRIAVFDIETISIEGKLYPYAIGIIVNESIRIFYLTDYYSGYFIKASNNTLNIFIDYLTLLN